MHFCFVYMHAPYRQFATRILFDLRDSNSNSLQIIVIYSLRLRQIAIKPRLRCRTGFGRSGKGCIVYGSETRTLVDKPKVGGITSGNFNIFCTVVVWVKSPTMLGRKSCKKLQWSNFTSTLYFTPQFRSETFPNVLWTSNLICEKAPIVIGKSF